MKSRRRSVLSSPRASLRRLAQTRGHASAASKFLVGVQSRDAAADQSLQPGNAAPVAPSPVKRMDIEEQRKVAQNPPSHAIDHPTLLRFSQQLYAHALTLQEVIRNGGEIAYNVLRPRCDRQAARQFEIFYGAADEPAAHVDFEPELVSQ
jgi:hypothetical protein